MVARRSRWGAASHSHVCSSVIWARRSVGTALGCVFLNAEPVEEGLEIRAFTGYVSRQVGRHRSTAES